MRTATKPACIASRQAAAASAPWNGWYLAGSGPADGASTIAACPRGCAGVSACVKRLVEEERGDGRRKIRPTCVVVAVRGAKDGLTDLALLAITTQPQLADRLAIDVSAMPACRARRYQAMLDRCRRAQSRHRRAVLLHRAAQQDPRPVQKASMMKIATAFLQARMSGQRVSRLD